MPGCNHAHTWNGVGGGIIIAGKIYDGKGLGGSELGHMVIVENGEPCTCGKKKDA